MKKAVTAAVKRLSSAWSLFFWGKGHGESACCVVENSLLITILFLFGLIKRRTVDRLSFYVWSALRADALFADRRIVGDRRCCWPSSPLFVDRDKFSVQIRVHAQAVLFFWFVIIIIFLLYLQVTQMKSQLSAAATNFDRLSEHCALRSLKLYNLPAGLRSSRIKFIVEKSMFNANFKFKDGLQCEEAWNSKRRKKVCWH